MDESPTPLDGSPATKKSRRQVAFYPNMNASNKPTKPFSRSAAKRESVMALGSIEHLQHYFTKAGIAAETNVSSKPNSNMVPAIGGFNLKVGRPMMEGIREFELPPSPTVPQTMQPTMSPFVKTYEIDPENLRPSVIEDLSAVEHVWRLRLNPRSSQASLRVDGTTSKDQDPEHVDILDTLRTTTHAVRSVRNYLLSLPDDTTTPVKPQFRSPVTLSSSPIPRRQASQPDLASDPLSRIRRSALEVLTVLRALEESSRLPLSDDAYDAQSDHGQSDHGEQASTSGGSGSGGSHSRAVSPAFVDTASDAPVSISYIRVGGRNVSVPVWEDEDDFDLNHLTEEEKRDRWDERLVLGGGWLYRQDIRYDDLLKEKEIIERYLDAVDDTLFGGRKDGTRGWERERIRAEKERRGKGRRVSTGDVESVSARRSNRRVVSTGMLDAMRGMALTEEPEETELSVDSVDDDDLPEWAKRASFMDSPLDRLQALFRALLPSSLVHLLPDESAGREALLQAISSGQVLCTAYNTGVRRSRKPWGFVNKDAIHDIAALEAQSVANDPDPENIKRGWTFRRTDNLRLWAAALKLRYNIPVYTPPTVVQERLTPGESSSPLGSPTPTAKRFPTGEPPILFDATLVARKDTGWEDMLEKLVLRWMNAVVEERRIVELSD